MEVELEMRHHDLDDLLRVLGKALLQLTRVAHQHLTRRRLLLQARRPNAETLLKFINV